MIFQSTESFVHGGSVNEPLYPQKCTLFCMSGWKGCHFSASRRLLRNPPPTVRCSSFSKIVEFHLICVSLYNCLLLPPDVKLLAKVWADVLLCLALHFFSSSLCKSLNSSSTSCKCSFLGFPSAALVVNVEQMRFKCNNY